MKHSYPTSITGELQPLDVAVNDGYKRILKGKFRDWYALEVEKLDNADVTSVVDLRTSLLKPLHASWLIETHMAVGQDYDCIRRAFDKSGILAALYNDDGDTESPPTSA